MEDIDRLIRDSCKDLRISLGYSQASAGKEIGCTGQNVSAFEVGKNDSGRILLWYIRKGLPIESIIHRR